MKKSVIVAIDSKNGYAKDGKIPWHYTEDFKFFRNTTMDQVCVMGRNTYEEINSIIGDKGKDSVLPNRICLVLSSTLKELPNAIVVSDVDELEYVLDNVVEIQDKEIFFIGGKQIFDYGLSVADNVYVTKINKDYNCDVFLDYAYIVNKYPNVSVTNKIDDLTFMLYKK